MDQPYILCGLGRVGERVLDHLRAAGAAVTVVDNRCEPNDPRIAGARLVQGDCRKKETLEAAGLGTARGVIIAISDDLLSLQTALMVRHLNPAVRVVVRLFNDNLLARLGGAVSNVFALSDSALAAPLFAAVTRSGQALGAFRLHEGSRQQIVECEVAPGSSLEGRSFADVAAKHAVTVVAYQAAGQPPRFLQDVPATTPLHASDHLVVCGRPRDVAPLQSEGQNESLPELLWAGIVRRIGRVVWRTVALIDWPVKVCTVLLLGVIAVSVLVFHFGMKNDTMIDAFYRTVSLIATGADMRGDQVEPGGWQKLYISFLRLFGVALLAAFTAIFTNYLVRANLGGALEVRRIPDSGHVIVVGLGNVSFRVIEELLAQDEPVVVIERNRNNPFIPTARRQNVPVIIGDATLLEVLKQANSTTARAVVAATENELANLEVALLARQLSPKQHVVIRIMDPTLAHTLRQAANIRFALSIPELVAPAFAGAIFGDKVRGLALVMGKLLAAYDFLVEAGDVMPLDRFAREFRCVPIAWRGADGTSRPLDLAASLNVGDHLTVIIALEDLRHVTQWSREKGEATALLPH